MVGTVEPSMYQWIRLDYNALLEWITIFLRDFFEFSREVQTIFSDRFLRFFMVMVMVSIKVMVFKTFEGALRLAAGAFSFWKHMFSEKK